MKLLLRRSERAGLFGRPIYVLDVRAELSEEERGWIVKYKLSNSLLYAKHAPPDVDRTTVTGLATLLVSHALNTTISVMDLKGGKRIEFKDISEMLEAEERLKERVIAFGQVLRAASQFKGEEVISI